jgi:hypothetical protein
MGPRVVIILEVSCQRPAQMPRTEDDDLKIPRNPGTTSEPTPLTPPVIGGRRSLREIPQGRKPEDKVPEPLVLQPDDALLKVLDQQPPQCRELIRKRLYGFAKRRTSNDTMIDPADISQSGLNENQSRLLRQFATEVLNGNAALLQQGWLLDYVEVPPSMMEFIRGDRFLGETYRPEEGADDLYPVGRKLWIRILTWTVRSTTSF